MTETLLLTAALTALGSVITAIYSRIKDNADVADTQINLERPHARENLKIVITRDGLPDEEINITDTSKPQVQKIMSEIAELSEAKSQ